MEYVPESSQYDSPPRSARRYWTEAARGLVEVGDAPRDSRDFKLAYRLYVLATLAMAERDGPEDAEANTGSRGVSVDVANRHFRDGINQALDELSRQNGQPHQANVFMEQDLSPRDWNVVMAREIGATLIFAGNHMPDSYLEILQAIEDERCTMRLD